MSIPASYISVRWQHREQGIQRSFKYFNFWRQKRRKIVDPTPTPVVCNCIPVFWWLSIIKSNSWNLKIRLFPVQNKKDILLIVLSAKPVLWTSWLSSIRWEVSKKSVRFSFDICQSWHYISFLQYHPKTSLGTKRACKGAAAIYINNTLDNKWLHLSSFENLQKFYLLLFSIGVELHNTQDRGNALRSRQGKGPVTVNLPSRNVHFWRDVVGKVWNICLSSSPFSSDMSVRCR